MHLFIFCLIVLGIIWVAPKIARAIGGKAPVQPRVERPQKPVEQPANFFGGPADGYVTPVPTDAQDYVVVPYIAPENQELVSALGPMAAEPSLAFYTLSSPLDEADGNLPFIYVRDISARELTELQRYGKMPDIQGVEE